MTKWVSDTNLDLSLDDIALSDEVAVCNNFPSTFYNAHWPDMWVAETAYTAGDIVHPPTPNGYIYECTVGGTSGVSEPSWGTSQDDTFSDNTITWKTHENYSLANYTLESGDKSIADAESPDTGRTLTVAGAVGTVVHRTGTVSHTALLRLATLEVKLVTDATTTTVGDNDVESGKAIVINDILINNPDPV